MVGGIFRVTAGVIVRVIVRVILSAIFGVICSVIVGVICSVIVSAFVGVIVSAFVCVILSAGARRLVVHGPILQDWIGRRRHAHAVYRLVDGGGQRRQLGIAAADRACFGAPFQAGG